jgi:hypothetical protein
LICANITVEYAMKIAKLLRGNGILIYSLIRICDELQPVGVMHCLRIWGLVAAEEGALRIGGA